MPGIERLQEIGGLAAPDLTDHNVVGPVSEGMFDQVADRDRITLDPPRLEADTVFPVNPELQGVLDGYCQLTVRRSNLCRMSAVRSACCDRFPSCKRT